jgi:hypothetical protein
MGAGERLTGSTADGPKLPLKSTELAKDWVFAALRSRPPKQPSPGKPALQAIRKKKPRRGHSGAWKFTSPTAG